MSKITLKANDLKVAIAKLAGFIEETIVLELTKQVSNVGTLAKLRACNGVAQAVVMMTYGGDAVEETLIFTNQLSTVVDAMATFGEELSLELLDGKAKITSGTAVADVSYAKECKEINTPNFEEIPTTVIGLSKDQFRRAVFEGGYINEKAEHIAFSQTCLLQPVINEEGKTFLKVYSSSGETYAESVVPCGINPNAIGVFKEFAKTPVILKSGPLFQIARTLKTEVVIYLSQKFVLLMTESEAYSFLTVAAKAVDFSQFLTCRFRKEFSFVLNKEKLRNAFKVVGLSASSSSMGMYDNVTITELEGGKVSVLVSDVDGINNATLIGEGTGNNKMTLKRSEIVRALDNTFGDNVCIYGNPSDGCIFISGENTAAFGMNATVNLSAVNK